MSLEKGNFKLLLDIEISQLKKKIASRVSRESSKRLTFLHRIMLFVGIVEKNASKHSLYFEYLIQGTNT